MPHELFVAGFEILTKAQRIFVLPPIVFVVRQFLFHVLVGPRGLLPEQAQLSFQKPDAVVGREHSLLLFGLVLDFQEFELDAFDVVPVGEQELGLILLDDFAHSQLDVIDGLAELLVCLFDFSHEGVLPLLLIAICEIGTVHILLLINIDSSFSLRGRL